MIRIENCGFCKKTHVIDYHKLQHPFLLNGKIYHGLAICPTVFDLILITQRPQSGPQLNDPNATDRISFIS